MNKNMNKEIYFTFDDGPSETTPLLLDILQKEKVRATFFVSNEYRHSHLLKRIVKDGHMICLHSYLHKYKEIYSSVENYFSDLNKIESLVYKETKIKCRYLRFPGGSYNFVSEKYGGFSMRELIEKTIKMGYRLMDWNCENYDGMDPDRSRDEYASAGIESISQHNTAVFLSHTRPGDEESILSLPIIFDWCRKNGYTTKTLDEYAGPPILNIDTVESDQ